MRNRSFGIVLSIVVLAGAFAVAAGCSRKQSKEEMQGKSRVFFVEPKDGATVQSPVKFEMGVEGMTVRPAGEIVAGTGHHHILINADAIAKGTAIPNDDTHRHFGKGQTETEIKLAPGKYKLTLQFADGHHQSYGPEMSQTIHITVK